MTVASANFVQLDKKDKIVILGDMFELGNESLKEHKAIVDLLLNDIKIDCFFIGKDFYKNKIDREHFYFYETFELFVKEIKQLSFQNKIILIKGSRGMALERILDFI